MDPRYRVMSEHRVSMLGSSLRRTEDPEHSSDPRVRTLVDALAAVDYAPAPDPRFRAELRTQLVAVAPRIIAESAATAEPAAASAADLEADEPLAAHRRRRRFTRPLAVAAGVAAAFLLLLGGAVWQSQKSLPGDSLYGLKRASENVQLDLSSGGTDRGHTYLKLAQTRVEEARALLRRDSASAAGGGTLAGGLSASTAKLISTNLASADADLRHGTELLATQAVTARSQSPISVIDRWAPDQLKRLQDLATALPKGSLQNRTKASWTLTRSALTRARSLAPAVSAGCASTSRTDSLGPVPTCTSRTPTSTPAPRVPTPTHAATAGTSAGRTAAVPTTGGTTHPRTSTPTRSTAPASTATPTARARPTLLPGASVSVGRCGISIAVGSIGVGVGGCPSHS